MKQRERGASLSETTGIEPALEAEVGEIRRLLVESSLESLGLASGLLEDLTKEIQQAVEQGLIFQESDLRLLLRDLDGLRTLADQGSNLTAGYLQALLGPAMDCFGGQADLESRTARLHVQA
ncbi:hypothetical protein [Paludibaculum fermentans]|uniref:hypothetical protein n=1 Tax=Paludibaculum fermentans TaxID=1473598 RepID=UPI003EBF97E0